MGRAKASPKKQAVEKPRRHTAIGHRLEATRQALGYERAAKFLKIIHCSNSRWSQYETGERRITLPVALRIAEEFDVTLDWIYRGKHGGLPGNIRDGLKALGAF